ncbi:CUB domain-containing protein [Nephila pilipes]|uniref:CUB domain-containing protein n=1 Tax=Nephila pilipes TaxID=299642 RepID=A0A8X6UC73_NEPPI|nr:CUB domain-containing protein [Nephila pilipes]
MMKCLVVRDEGIIWVFLVFIAGINCLFLGEHSQTIQELCSSNRYIYDLESEESYQLILTSSNSSGQINKWYQKSKRRCRKEFKTNNGASHISVVISNISISSCSEKCHCNYLEIAESGHKEKFCGEIKEHLYFESKNNYLSIEFHHTLSMKFEVTLSFVVKRNTYIITGLPREGYQSGHFLETPYFPQSYPFDYIAEYILQSDDLSGHVMLMFLDYQIAPESIIEVFGHNGTHPVRYFGDVFRPPVFVSQEHQLNLRFEANSQVQSGFRAVCFFIKDSDLQNSKPFTNCGGFEGGYGGSLTIEVQADQEYYDCLWHVVPPVPAIIPKSYFLTISNISLQNIGPNASFEFREGLNSKAKLVKSIYYNNSNLGLISSEITVPAATGLYIRFNGKLKPDSVLKMIYSTYRNGNCSKDEVLCNERCLFSELRCDGIEHCPDGKDEQECTSDSTILQSTTDSIAVKRRLHSENTFASFIVVLSIGICGFLLFLSIVIFFIYRHFKVSGSSTNPREQQYDEQEMTGTFPNVCSRISSCFDEPPSYEDFIQSSDCYPPLFYTRPTKRYSEPHCNLYTSRVCGKNSPRHHTIHFFNSHDLSSISSDSNTSGNSALFPEPGCSFSRNNIEWTIDNSQQRTSTPISLKRAASFDSQMNKKLESDTCHLHLSITHSMHPQSCISKHHSLPTRLKIKELKSNEIDITFSTIIPEVQCDNERRFSSCIICNDSLTVRSEIMTTIKARCFSDPCKTNL